MRLAALKREEDALQREKERLEAEKERHFRCAQWSHTSAENSTQGRLWCSHCPRDHPAGLLSVRELWLQECC